MLSFVISKCVMNFIICGGSVFLCVLLYVLFYYCIPERIFDKEIEMMASAEFEINCRRQYFYRKLFFKRLCKIVSRKTHKNFCPAAALKKLETSHTNILGAIPLAYNYSHPHEHHLSASISTECKKPSVYINMGWALQLFINPTAETEHAFQTSLGHEISHLNDYPYAAYKGKQRKFIRYTNEIRADFNGILLGVNGNVSVGLSCIEYKKKRCGLQSHYFSSADHPSWNRREKYISNFLTFDEFLIRQIAKDVGCKDQNLITSVVSHYQNDKITLHK